MRLLPYNKQNNTKKIVRNDCEKGKKYFKTF